MGASTDKPAPGDYDGDGKLDAAVFRPSDTVWYILRSSGGSTATQFGLPNDVPVRDRRCHSLDGYSETKERPQLAALSYFHFSTLRSDVLIDDFRDRLTGDRTDDPLLLLPP